MINIMPKYFSKTISKKTRMRKTMKKMGGAKPKMVKTGVKNSTKASIVKSFLEMLNAIKLYHWKTDSYSQHKATDDLHDKLSGNVDKFVEVLLGKDESRVKMVDNQMKLIDSQNASDFKNRMYQYRDMLLRMDSMFHKKGDSDLLNIRDEMLGDINQFLYLMTFH